MIRGTREVDMKSIIGKYELTPVVHSLMKRDGTLLDGWDGKSDLAKTVLKETDVSITPSIPFESEGMVSFFLHRLRIAQRITLKVRQR